MMPAGDQLSGEQLYAVLQGLGSTSKEARDGAEAVYERDWVCRPASLFPGLLELIARIEDPIIKSIGAVLLRKAVLREAQGIVKPEGEGPEHMWTQMDGTLQEQCRAALLQLFERESVPEVQHRLGDAIAEVARIQSEYGEWPELLELLFRGARSGSNEALLMSLMRVLGAVPEILENRLQEIDAVAGLIQFCLNQSNGKIRLEALRAMVSLLYVLADEEEDAASATQIQKAFQGIVNVSPQLIVSFNAEPEIQSEAILSFIDLVSSHPKLFKTPYPALTQLLLQLVGNKAVDEDVRKGGLELLLTLVDMIKKARKDSALLGNVLALLVRLVGEVEEDPQDWKEREPEEDDLCEAEMISQYAEQGLDRLAIELGGAALMPHLSSILPSMSQSPSWTDRYAALRSLASIAEGCLDTLEDNLESVLNLIWPAFQDPHPRVQYSACHALGQLCTDFNGAIQETFCERALTSLVGVLVGSQEPRVQTHAAAALINFAEGVESEALTPFLDELLARLVGLLSAPGTPLYLQSQLMATLGAFSSAAGQSFVRYYDAVVPSLLACVKAPCDPTDKPRRQLQCRALESLSLVFYALGRERIQPSDLDALVQHMLVLQQSDLADDDEMVSFLSAGWSRLCRILPDHAMGPLLPLLIPKLLKQANQKADLAALDIDESLEGYDQADWQFATVRGKRLGIRTATLDSKLEALQDLYGYVDALQAAYLPVAKETVEVALPLLSFSLHEGIQAASAELLAILLPLMHQADPAGSALYIQVTTQELLNSWEAENYNLDFTYASLDALADLMPVLVTVLGQALPQAVFAKLPSLLSNIIDSIQERLNGASAQDEDDADEDDMQDCEDEEALLYALSRFFAAFLRAFGNATAPFIGDLVTFCTKSATAKQASPSMRHAALCILDDLIHWTGPSSSNHAPAIANALATGLAEQDDTDVRQAALFGVGMAAEHGGPAYKSFLEAVLPGALLPILSAPNAKAPSQRDVTDNAASAAGRLFCSLPELATPQAVSTWLTAFPVVHDSDEIIPAYRSLVTMLRAGRVPADRAVLKTAIEPALCGPKDNFVADPALRSELTSLI